MAAKRKPDVNRQALILCEPCQYRLRGSRTQLARAIPPCPLCAGPMFPDFDTAALIMAPDALTAHPDHERETSAWGQSSKQSACAQAGPATQDRGMSDRWLKAHGIQVGSRRWAREDFEELGRSLTLAPRVDAMAF